MGQYSDNAVDAVAYFRKFLGRTHKKRKDRRRHTKMLKVCEYCGKYPTFFHETARDKWIMAEYADDNSIVQHVCKMKDRLCRT